MITPGQQVRIQVGSFKGLKRTVLQVSPDGWVQVKPNRFTLWYMMQEVEVTR